MLAQFRLRTERILWRVVKHLRHSAEGEVVRLRTARREDYLVNIAPDELGNLLASAGNGARAKHSGYLAERDRGVLPAGHVRYVRA